MRRVCIGGELDPVSERMCLTHCRIDAELGLHSADDDLFDTPRIQNVIELGIVEGAPVAFGQGDRSRCDFERVDRFPR